VFALFPFSGVYEASPHLAWVPVDLTAILAVASLRVAAWYLLFVSRSLGRSVVATALLGVLGAALALLDGRGPLAATLLTLGALAVAAFPLAALHRTPNRLAPGRAAGVGTPVAAVTYADSLRVTEKLRETFGDEPDPATTGRLENWTFAVESWRSGRTLTGHGLASWARSTTRSAAGRTTWSSNCLVELGLIGLVSFSLPVVVGLALRNRRYRETRDPGCIVVLALFVCTLLDAQMTGDLNEKRFPFAAIGLLRYGASVRRSEPVSVDRLVDRGRRLLGRPSVRARRRPRDGPKR